MSCNFSLRLSMGVALLVLMPTGHVLGQQTYGFTDFEATGSRAAHEIFLQGLLQLHNFEYGDARASFQAAQAEDPDAKRRELEEMLAAKQSPFPRAEAFSVHELIDPRETRPMLCRWIDRIQPLLPPLLGPTALPYRP